MVALDPVTIQVPTELAGPKILRPGVVVVSKKPVNPPETCASVNVNVFGGALPRSMALAGEEDRRAEVAPARSKCRRDNSTSEPPKRMLVSIHVGDLS
jgi:hypothetical protein